MDKLKINIRDKGSIQNYCEVQIGNDELIRVKPIACLLEERYALYVILQYILEDLKVPKDKIWRGKQVKYLNVMTDRGHITLCNDLYYNYEYQHHYTLHKCLEVDIVDIKPFITHHVSLQKGDNSIRNLHLFYDVASHMIWHGLLNRGLTEKMNIVEFSTNYVEDLLERTTNEDEVKKIELYLNLMKKLSKVHSE